MDIMALLCRGCNSLSRLSFTSFFPPTRSASGWLTVLEALHLARKEQLYMVAGLKKISVSIPSVIAVIGGLLGLTEFQTPARALTRPELMQVATDLSRQYDTSYQAKDAAAMAMVYASDGVLISPPGPIVRGREALKAYYVNRFAAGARDHTIKVLEVHVLGEGGYSIDRFSVTVPQANGTLREQRGTIVAVYRRARDGWHLSLVAPSVPEMADKQSTR